MILPDVNVLVYAHREDTLDHRAYRDWLESAVNSDAAFGMSDLVISGFVRKGNLVPDARLAAMAIEHGCEWITTDGDFARFPGLRWRHPLRS